MAADEINTIEKGASEKMEKTIGVAKRKVGFDSCGKSKSAGFG